MPTLNWIGKEAVMNHDKEVPFRLLKKVKSASVGKDSQNLIIHGDNLEALKALMPYYGGKVKCVYIDPPYNTGNESWVYNDKVNSPKIKKWLGKVVGRESEDLCRHDKWLCMMYPRLSLLKQLLRDDGAIFISIDDAELFSLKHIMDEIFGIQNFRACITWQRKYSVSNNFKGIATIIDYILVYSKSENFQNSLLPRTAESIERYSNPDNDPRGPWKAVDYLNQVSPDKRPNLCYEIVNPNTKQVIRNTKKAWKYELDAHKKHIQENRLWWGVKGNNTVPALKLFLSEVRQGMTPHNWWPHEDAGHTDEAKKEIDSILGANLFDTPKPIRLINRILQISTGPDDLILDSFAGSGTTGHAVLQLNKEDGGKRKFILIEMEDAIAKDITAKRIKTAIDKFNFKDGFEYCELDKPLFNENGQIEESCDFNQFATYIYFTETQTNIDRTKVDTNFIGELNETEYYLIYKEKGKNILDKGFLKKLRKTEAKKIVYADNCTIDEKILDEYNVLFKQIPYEVKVY
ncbi:MAG: site-specific DNA-methyltransferase [Candidatus Peribacter sp.]|nr:site-specific DNA-methyltransferase [Candidatus Peribacter sp.]